MTPKNIAAKNLKTDRRYRSQVVKARKGKGSYSRKAKHKGGSKEPSAQCTGALLAVAIIALLAWSAAPGVL